MLNKELVNCDNNVGVDMVFNPEKPLVDDDMQIKCDNPILDIPDCGMIDIRYADDLYGTNTVSIPLTSSKYISFTTDGGATWGLFKKFVGDDSASTGSATLTSDVDVIGVGTVGAVSDGYTFPAGDDLTSVLIKIMQASIPPAYTSPACSLSYSVSSPVEVNSIQNVGLIPHFIQYDAGALGTVEFFKNGTLIHSQSNLATYTDASYVIPFGPIQYISSFTYATGPIKNDNFGNPHPTGRIMAGTINATRYLVGSYYNVHGNYATMPSTGSLIKSGGVKTFSNTFILNTGSVNKNMVIAIPSTKTLSSVVDLNNGFDITSSYNLNPLITTLPDGGGNSVSYKVYELSIAVAYAVNHQHNITIT